MTKKIKDKWRLNQILGKDNKALKFHQRLLGILIKNPKPVLLVGQDYDGFTRIIEADGRGLVVGVRQPGAMLIGKGTHVAAGGAGATVSLSASANEVWEVVAIAVFHNDVVARDVNMFYDDGGFDKVYLLPQDVVSVAASTQIPIYPQTYWTGPPMTGSIGFQPLTITDNTYPVVKMVLLADTKTLSVFYLYRIMQKPTPE